MTNEELVQKLDEMQLKIDRLEAVTICANLMSRYVNYHAAFRHKDYVEFWAKRDDDILEMPWGKYLGFESVKKCYLDHHFDRGDEGAEEKMKGAVFFHHLDTPIIEVAADGKTARGAWWSPGHETFPRGDREPGQGAIWAWSKYGADFIKEDDGWKIWRMRIYPMFKTPVGTSWTEWSQFSGPMDLSEFPETDAPCTDTPWYMGVNSVYPADQPEPPLPYNSYSDLKKTFFGDMI